MFEDFTSFVTPEYIFSFAGMIVLVGLLTQFTKNLFDKIFQNHTKYVVYWWAFFFCALAAAFQGDFSTLKEVILSLVTWAVNSVIIWFTAMKAYEVITSKDRG